MNNVCIDCKKEFKCNGGCAKVNGRGEPYSRGMCCCPKCAKKARKKSIYAYEDLLTVCSRFLEEKEVVSFT